MSDGRSTIIGGLLGALLSLPALAQGYAPPLIGAPVVNADGSRTLTFADGSTAILPAIPAPSSSVPSPAPAGQAGTAGTYMPGNAVPLSKWRSATAVTSATGTFTVTWQTPFVSSSPVPEQPSPINTTGTTMPIVCNYTTFSQTGATGFCQQSSIVSISVNTASVNPFTSPAPNVTIGVVGHEPSQ